MLGREDDVAAQVLVPLAGLVPSAPPCLPPILSSCGLLIIDMSSSELDSVSVISLGAAPKTGAWTLHPCTQALSFNLMGGFNFISLDK